ncbi:MAG: LysE family transporter [Desulfobacterales bacterium]|nr:LysE family transporter [Desulfobacterales bacterium]
MLAIILDGFLTGLILQIAIGPVFFFILNISLQKTIMDGLFAVSAVTLADYIFIALAVLGVGKLLEKPKIKLTLGIISSLVLILFGIIMIISVNPSNQVNSPANLSESNYIASFISAFLLTISSPLTIVFWTSLFAAKAIERGYAQKQLIYFGLAAGLATLVFLGSSVTLLAIMRAKIPVMLLRISNIAVGSLLIFYGVVRLFRIAINTKRNS